MCRPARTKNLKRPLRIRTPKEDRPGRANGAWRRHNAGIHGPAGTETTWRGRWREAALASCWSAVAKPRNGADTALGSSRPNLAPCRPLCADRVYASAGMAANTGRHATLPKPAKAKNLKRRRAAAVPKVPPIRRPCPHRRIAGRPGHAGEGATCRGTSAPGRTRRGQGTRREEAKAAAEPPHSTGSRPRERFSEFCC